MSTNDWLAVGEIVVYVVFGGSVGWAVRKEWQERRRRRPPDRR